MRVRWLVASSFVLSLVVSLSACAEPPASQAVTEGSATDAPFDGELAGTRGAEDALECQGDTFRRGVGDPEGGLEENGDSPGLGLDHWLDPESWLQQVPDTGYAIEREDGGRALLSYDDEQDRTVIAFVMQDGQKDYYDDDEGWMVESYAMCDPSQWPDGVADQLGWGVWTNDEGQTVPITTVVSFEGAEHCGWQDSTWIWLGKDGEEGEFIGNPRLDLRDGLRTSYALDVPVPTAVRDSGYQRDGSRLLIAEDGSAAYLVSVYEGADQTVGDRWPSSKEPIRCA